MSEYIQYVPPKRDNYFVDQSGYWGNYSGGAPEERIETPIGIKDIGQTVTEGQRFGSLIQTSQNAIKLGTGKIELQVGQGGGGEPVGAENYGQDARQALRELSMANQVEFTSVHAPTNIGNLSGFNPQQGFSEQQRAESIEEIKKAIKFAGDVTNGGAVVVHTGEYWRDMSEMRWNEKPTTITGKDKDRAVKDSQGRTHEFLTYPDEYKDQSHYLVDSRSGKLIQDVKKNMIVHEPEFKTAYDPKEGKERYVDKDGNFIEHYEAFEKGVPEVGEDGRFKTKELKWEDFRKMANDYNEKEKPDRKKTPAEMFIQTKLNSQIKQSEGLELYHSKGYKENQKLLEDVNKRKEEIEKIQDKDMTEEEKIALLESLFGQSAFGQLGLDQRTIKDGLRNGDSPSDIIKKNIENDINNRLSEVSALSTSYATSAKEAKMNRDTIEPMSEYAKRKSLESYADLGIEAMEESRQKKTEKPIFVAPENIFPEMGYGSHPEELIELVHTARDKMVERLTNKYIEEKDHNGKVVEQRINPNYRGLSKAEAKKEAKEHIKATLDTQHLGMWWKHFQPLAGETYDQRRERFNKWYKKMVEKMQDEEVIGHMHLVDSLGSGHHHLPAGQGNLPLYEALEKLKEKGFKGTIVSEAFGEESLFGQGRILTETWKHFGGTIKGYGAPAPNPTFGNVHGGYFAHVQSPYFTFGSYVPSNEWKLWSEVPFE
ncbi:MAG: TIM barrel protein [Nanoarchaeota archaeon]